MKTNFNTKSIQALVLISAIIICGCAHSPDPRFYLILSKTPVTVAFANPAVPMIGLRPIELASYLNRPQIVMRKGEREIVYSQFDRWAEPLETQVSTYITDSLAGKLNGFRIRSFPWRDADVPLMEVSITILNLEGTEDGSVNLRANWQITLGSGKKSILEESRSELSVKSAEPGIPGVVASVEDLLGQLSQIIADVVIKHSTIQ